MDEGSVEDQLTRVGLLCSDLSGLMSITRDLGSSKHLLSQTLPQLEPFHQPEWKHCAKNESENLLTELSLWGQCHELCQRD